MDLQRVLQPTRGSTKDRIEANQGMFQLVQQHLELAQQETLFTTPESRKARAGDVLTAVHESNKLRAGPTLWETARGVEANMVRRGQGRAREQAAAAAPPH